MTMGGLTLDYADHWLKNAFNEMCSETHSNIFGKVFLSSFIQLMKHLYPWVPLLLSGSLSPLALIKYLQLKKTFFLFVFNHKQVKNIHIPLRYFLEFSNYI